jgi:multidrug transporter EmrE-like cation transporter
MAEGGNVGGYYTGMFIIGFVLLFIAIADLAVGIANAVICGMLGSVGYGIWGSILVSVRSSLERIIEI